MKLIEHPEHQIFRSRPRNLVDVTGCGDMVLAALGVCRAGGLNWPDACEIANAAAGLKVERRGSVPVQRWEVIRDLLDSKQICTELVTDVRQAAHSEGTLVLTNGCFDGIHPGHLHLLKEAKAQGSTLIVAVNSDESVSELKGSRRPVHPLKDRMDMLAAIADVDYVVSFNDEVELAELASAIMPDVIVKGDDFKDRPVTGSKFANRVHFVQRLPGYSTTEMLKKFSA